MSVRRQPQGCSSLRARLVESIRLHLESGRAKRNWKRVFFVELAALELLLLPLECMGAYSLFSMVQVNGDDVFTSVSPGGAYTLEMSVQSAAIGGKVPVRVALFQGDPNRLKAARRYFVVDGGADFMDTMRVKWEDEDVVVFLPSDGGRPFVFRMHFDDCLFTEPSPFS